MKILGMCVLAVLTGTPALAQIPVGTFVGAPASGYDSAARRDPFLSLIASKRPNAPAAPDGRTLPPGLRSIALVDVEVTGIVRKGDTMMAILQGADRQSYVAKAQDQLLDAVVLRIDRQGVVFAGAAVPGVPGRPQEIRKTLRGAAEGSR